MPATVAGSAAGRAAGRAAASEAGTDPARLFVALSRITRAVRRDAPVGEIGPGALGALSTLVRSGPQRLGALAANEGVSPPSMTRIVAALLDAGLARRTPDPDDGRASLIEPTATGRQLVETGSGDRLAALGARLDRLDGAQRAALQAALPTLEALAED